VNHGAAPGERCRRTLAALLAATVCAGCGKEGPPLPPLVRVPVAPAEFRAERRGDTVDVQFVVPNANTDGSRPADVSRVDVYAITSASPVSDDQLIELGTRIGSVDVRPPRDEDEPPPSEPATDAAVSGGVDQGAVAHVAEDLTADAAAPVPIPAAEDARADRPLVGPISSVLARTFAAVGVSRRGRRSPLSARDSVPLVAAPLPPPPPDVEYTETAVAVTWQAVPGGTAAPADAAGSGVLPSRPIGMAPQPTVAYHVYELTASEDATAPRVPRRLTEKPVATTTFSDPRVSWGAERCYTVSVVKTFEGLALESESAPPRCGTFTDTFAPATPAGVVAVASEGAISLIWDSVAAADLAGYIVSRSQLPATDSQQLTPAAVAEASYRDGSVTAGERYAYTVRAVDKAGNISAPSEAVEETAR
jgi:hypothetical protein